MKPRIDGLSEYFKKQAVQPLHGLFLFTKRIIQVVRRANTSMYTTTIYAFKTFVCAGADPMGRTIVSYRAEICGNILPAGVR